MRITIHRGANQIGGCITEIATEKTKIFIDFGANLPGNQNPEFTKEQIDEITRDTDAIFYTHSHGDHVGLFHLVPPNISQYIGEGAKEVLLCKYDALMIHNPEDYAEKVEAIKRMRTYNPNQQIDVSQKGEIFVTPYFVSHSAFDAYMFLIECEGKKILHTGDFRNHGYIGKGLFKVLEKYVRQVDILITEGTMLGREQESVCTENEIQQNIISVLENHKYLFVLCSSTDIDRLASLHAACKKTGRVFCVDQYQKKVLDIFTESAGNKSNLFNFDNTFELINYSTEKVKRKLQTEGFLMPIRVSSEQFIKKLLDVFNDEEPWLIYSMWSGYAEEGKDYSIEAVSKIRNLFNGRIYDGTQDGFHTSGHADIRTLQEVCTMVKPCIGVIPIHKEESTSYENLPDVCEYKVFTESKTNINDNITINIL
jgi:ribonuclease J